MYSPDQILSRCPETVTLDNQTYTFHEWCIEDSLQKIPYLIRLFDYMSLSEIENFRQNEEAFKKECKVINFHYPVEISKLLLLMCPSLPIEAGVHCEKYGDLLYLIAKQNDALNKLHELRTEKEASEKPEKKQKSNTDIFDIVADIIGAKLWNSDLNFLNYKQKLTFRQLFYLASKAANIHKRQMINYYTPLIFALSQAFANSDNKITFQEALNPPSEEEKMSEWEASRRAWFYDKWNDVEFVVKRSEEIGLDINIFYPESELAKLKIA